MTTRWLLVLLASCAAAWPRAEAQPADSTEVRYVANAGYIAPRALVSDYVVCAVETRLLRSADQEAEALVALLDAQVDALQEAAAESAAAQLSCRQAADARSRQAAALEVDNERVRGALQGSERALTRARLGLRLWRVIALAGAAGVATLVLTR